MRKSLGYLSSLLVVAGMTVTGVACDRYISEKENAQPGPAAGDRINPDGDRAEPEEGLGDSDGIPTNPLTPNPAIRE